MEEDRNKEIKPLQETMGERIAWLRRAKGLTQAQLAEKLGLSAQAVSKWESGLSCPDIMTVVPLARILGISADALLGGEDLYNEEKDIEKVRDIGEGEQGNEDGKEAEAFGTGKVQYKPADKIESLNVKLGVSETFIREGDSFSLELIGYAVGECQSRVENGVWTISDRTNWNLFGIHFGRLLHNRKVILTVPREHHFQGIRLEIGAGTVTAESLKTDTCTLNVGAGQATLIGLRSGKTKVECGVGEVKLVGALSGKCKIECGMGSITAKLAPLKEYGYKISVGMGEVKLGENKMSGMGGCQQANQNAENFFDINCSMGSVEVQFSDC